jgi:CBS-domain-containing membrane protein
MHYYISITSFQGLHAALNVRLLKHKTDKTPWPESASELYQPSDRRLSAKLVPTFADRGCHVVSVTDPYGCILGLIDRKHNPGFLNKTL